MPEKIEISTKLIALLTAIIVLISTVLTLRKKKESAQQTSQSARSTNVPDIWDVIKNMIGILAFLIILFGGLKILEIIQSYHPK